MLDLALKTNIPIIGIHTDDLLTYKSILQSIAGKNIFPLSPLKSAVLAEGMVYYREGGENIDADLYRRLVSRHAQLVVINPDKPSTFIFDTGELEVPSEFVTDYLFSLVPKENIPALVLALKGLSLKGVSEVVQLTMARTGSLTPSDVKGTRFMLGTATPGLEQLTTEYEFYDMPKLLKEWLDTNYLYFQDSKIPTALVPRGILLSGGPGTGKTSAARVIANLMKLPLYRLNIATALSKWLGQSENQVAKSLVMVDKESPCVLLLDEVNKLFAKEEDSGATSRILAELLWWLQEHKSRVLTIMTTNKIEVIPPELYRPGRIDRVIHIPTLYATGMQVFACNAYQAIMGEYPNAIRRTEIKVALGSDPRTHMEVIQTVADLIKKNDWYDILEKSLDKLSLNKVL